MKQKIGVKPKCKTIQIGWKHRDSTKLEFVKMGKPHGGNKQITLNMNKDYTVEEIKNIAINQFKNILNENYFTKCLIELGTNDRELVTDFISDSGEVEFWSYASKIRDRAHRYSLYLLTTKISTVPSPTVKGKENRAVIRLMNKGLLSFLWRAYHRRLRKYYLTLLRRKYLFNLVQRMNHLSLLRRKHHHNKMP